MIKGTKLKGLIAMLQTMMKATAYEGEDLSN